MMSDHVGRHLWATLHDMGANTINWTAQESFFVGWLKEVEVLLGCPSCFRKVEWFLKLWPVDFGEGFELWGWCLHDYVNKELGKPLNRPGFTLAPLKQKGIIQ